jgi:hypothetical protein
MMDVAPAQRPIRGRQRFMLVVATVIAVVAIAIVVIVAIAR